MIEVLLQGTDDINSGQKFQPLISRGAPLCNPSQSVALLSRKTDRIMFLLLALLVNLCLDPCTDFSQLVLRHSSAGDWDLSTWLDSLGGTIFCTAR
jgi:hypothetical protein